MSSVGLSTGLPLRAPRIRRGVMWLAVAVALDLLWAMVSVGYSLHATREGLGALARATASGNVDALEGILRDASESARSARTALDRHPSVRLLRAAGLGSDLDAAMGVARVAEESASIGVALLSGLESLSDSGALISEGRFLAAGIDRLRDEVFGARVRLAELLTDVRSLDRSHFGWLNARVSEVTREVTAATVLGERLDGLLSILPSLAGYDGERRYLLAFQSPSEARGGGGLVGLYGVMHVDSGRFRLGHVGSTRELNEGLRGDVAAPKWFDQLYGALGAREDARLANLSPSFPAVAKVLLNMYESGSGKRPDGVIAMDPIAFGKLTKATGPLEAPGWDVRVDSTNARRLLLKDVYVRFGRWRSRAQNAYLEALVRELWSELFSGRVAAAGLGAAWADAAATQHFKIYSEDPTEQEKLASLGVAGDLRSFGPQVQMVFHNNWSGSKVDHYFRRRLETSIALTTSGAADIITTVSLRNRSPGEGTLLGRARGVNDLPPGLNRMTLSGLLPVGATDVEVSVEGTVVTPSRGRDAGYPVVWVSLDVPARSEREVSFRYSVPDFFTPGEATEMTFHPQVMERPDLAEITIVPPPGYAIEGLERAERLERETWLVSRLLKGPATLRWTVVAD